ncbi:hypothetical protein MLD38_029646 [Melastoma candidum]|uniref:Uncharacterized protein n=1 Tax=Melastoma candidum TaxID=119954 RepID=A0ACB9N603_9MYRT|nr:hypothetical protein MLD38_029646 [Melastoma candidum]
MELIPGLPDDVARECLIRLSHTSFPAASTTCKQWKEEIEAPEFRLWRMSHALSQVLLVVAQARPGPVRSPGCLKLPLAPSYRLAAFEPVSGRWWELPPPPGCPDGIPMFCQLVAAGTDLVLVGGIDPVTWEASGSVYVYSFVRGEWRSGADMPGTRRSFFACASDGQGLVFVAGGHDGDKNALRSAMAYDVVADQWMPMPDMAEERDECKGVFSKGRFLVLGGYPTDTQGRFVRSAEEFDRATWQWRPATEDVLGSGTSPRTCTSSTGKDGDEALYMCKDGELLVGSKCPDGTTGWRVAGRLPSEVGCPAHVATWQGKVMVIGSARFGEPHVGYVLEAINPNEGGDEGNSSSNEDRVGGGNGTWVRVEFEEGFSGHVQAGCLFDI